MARSLLPTDSVNVSLYQAAAALDASSRWQEAIAENLASSSVPGFKQSQLSQEATQAGLMPAAGLRGAPTYFSLPKSSQSTNFTPGNSKYTGNGTDVSIDGKGFFEVQLPNGQKALTRDGEFQISSAGQLVTRESYPVLGTDGSPIQLNRENSGAVTISTAGAVSQGSEVRGKVGVMDVDQPRALTQLSGGYFMATPGKVVETPSKSSVRGGYLESSNTDTLREMVNMMTAGRSFEANQKVIQIQDDRLGKIISEVGNPQ